MSGGDRMASLVEHALETVPCDVVLVPTRGGTTARVISRYKPPVWLVAPSADPAVCQGLAFSYGVHPVHLTDEPADWREYARALVSSNTAWRRSVSCSSPARRRAIRARTTVSS